MSEWQFCPLSVRVLCPHLSRLVSEAIMYYYGMYETTKVLLHIQSTIRL